MNLHNWKIVGLSLRKRAEILLLLCILCFLMPAFGLSVTSISVGTGNDWYTMGLGYNQDDGLSFGAYGSAIFDNGLRLASEIKGYTDRISSKHRHDELHIRASYPFFFSVSPHIGISTVGSAGVVLAGDIGLQTIQNSFHSLIGRDYISLEYSRDGFSVHPLLELAAQAGWLENNTLVGLELGVSYARRWEQSLYANALLSYGSALTLRLGYLAKQGEDSDLSQASQVQRYRGLRLAFTYDGQLFEMKYFSFLQSGFSYGSYGVNPLALHYPKTYQHTDFTFSSGILYNLEGHQNRLTAFGFGPFTFETRHTNGPMLNRWEDQNDRMNLGSWLFGYRVFLNGETAPFRLYVKALAGLRRFNLQQNYTTTIVEELRPSIGIETGIRLGGECWWIIGNTSYHPRLALSLHYVFGTDSIRDSLITIEEFKPHTGPFILTAGLILDIDHDLS